MCAGGRARPGGRGDRRVVRGEGSGRQGVGALTGDGKPSSAPGRRSAGAGEVRDRPWPSRVTAPGPWSATLSGAGDRFAFTTDGVVERGLASATFDLGPDDEPDDDEPDDNEPDESPRNVLVLRDGSRWWPRGPFHLDAPGDLPFTASDQPVGLLPASEERAFRSVEASGSSMQVRVPSLEAALASAGGPVTALGNFVGPDGNEVVRLPLPAGTRLSRECPSGDEPGAASCRSSSERLGPFPVVVDAGPGMTVRATGDGEAAVAGSVEAEALGRRWDGLVGAVEAKGLSATAVHDRGVWRVTAEGGQARQVWIDVWPVVDTMLSARSVAVDPGPFDTKDFKIQWTNVGFATSQIFEAEGSGSGARTVGFDLNKTLGHDAGLNVRRGDRVENLRGGGDIDSNLAPGESVDRKLSGTAGTQATIALRRNFPEVRVPLAIPSSAPAP